MTIVSIRLFCKFSAQYQDIDVCLEARKVQELLCYLLLHRQRPHYREALAGLLWADCSIAQSKSYLRKALWQLQTALDVPTEAAVRLLTLDEEWIQINPAADLWLDVAEFETAYAGSKGIQGSALTAAQMKALRHAVGLYEGDLFEGCYQDWLLFERERLQQMYIAMLDKLMGYCETQGLYEEGILYGTHVLSYDQARERTHQRLMRLYYLAHDRTAALRQYDRCVAILMRELGVGPDEHTTALYEHIRAHRSLGPSLVTAIGPPIDGAAPAWLRAALDRLKRTQSTLASAQLQIQQDIRAIEHVLENHY
jgi:DNA-binding SARP family transcriptional activator